MVMTSKGYAGTVDTTDYARLAAKVWGSTYGVVGMNDWKPGSTTSVARGVTVASGTGYGYGVEDASDATVVLSADVVASGTRYDTLVARRDWQPGVVGDRTKFMLIKGGSTLAISPDLLHNPGVQDDQPLAIFAVTGSTATLTEDLRLWKGYGGGLVGLSLLARDYANQIGTRIWIGATEYIRTINASGTAQWVVQLQNPLYTRRGWAGLRSQEDGWGANTNGTMAAVNIPSAPAGTYLLSGNADINLNGAGVGEECEMILRYIANSELVGNREFYSRGSGGIWRAHQAVAYPYYHDGGGLSVGFQARASRNARVRRGEVTVSYLGPAAG